MTIREELDELQRKAGNYDALKGEYDRFKTKVFDAIKSLGISLNEQSTEFSEKKHRISSGLIQGIINKLYDKMRTEDNYQVGRDKVVLAFELEGFENQPQQRINRVLMMLKTKKGVEHAKDGHFLRLWYITPKQESDKIKFDKVSYMK